VTVPAPCVCVSVPAPCVCVSVPATCVCVIVSPLCPHPLTFPPCPCSLSKDVCVQETRQEMFERVSKLAQAGDVEASCTVARCLMEGDGVDVDYNRGFTLLRAAAKRRHHHAECMLPRLVRIVCVHTCYTYTGTWCSCMRPCKADICGIVLRLLQYCVCFLVCVHAQKGHTCGHAIYACISDVCSFVNTHLCACRPIGAGVPTADPPRPPPCLQIPLTRSRIWDQGCAV